MGKYSNTDYTIFNKNEIKFIKLLFVSIVVILIAMIIAYSVSKSLTPTDIGAIGDTVGGLTAPFIGLLAAFLVYKSFVAQIQTNSQQIRYLLNEQNFNQIVYTIDDMLKHFEYELSFGNSTIKLVEMQVEFVNRRIDGLSETNKTNLRRRAKQQIQTFSNTLKNMLFLKQLIDNTELNEEVKKVFYHKISNAVLSKYPEARLEILYINYSMLLEKEDHSFLKENINDVLEKIKYQPNL